MEVYFTRKAYEFSKTECLCGEVEAVHRICSFAMGSRLFELAGEAETVLVDVKGVNLVCTLVPLESNSY